MLKKIRLLKKDIPGISYLDIFLLLTFTAKSFEEIYAIAIVSHFDELVYELNDKLVTEANPVFKDIKYDHWLKSHYSDYNISMYIGDYSMLEYIEMVLTSRVYTYADIDMALKLVRLNSNISKFDYIRYTKMLNYLTNYNGYHYETYSGDGDKMFAYIDVMCTEIAHDYYPAMVIIAIARSGNGELKTPSYETKLKIVRLVPLLKEDCYSDILGKLCSTIQGDITILNLADTMFNNIYMKIKANSLHKDNLTITSSMLETGTDLKGSLLEGIGLTRSHDLMYILLEHYLEPKCSLLTIDDYLAEASPISNLSRTLVDSIYNKIKLKVG